jgi:spore germination protein KB
LKTAKAGDFVNKDELNKSQIAVIVTQIMLSSVFAITSGYQAKQDSWLALAAAYVFGIPLIMIYARIMSLYPAKSIFEIVDEIFGKICGVIIAIFLFLYFFQIAVMSLYPFLGFSKIIALSNTPKMIISVLIGLVCAYIVKKGTNTLGKFSLISTFVITLIITAVSVFLVDKMKIDNFLPVFTQPFWTVAEFSATIFIFPFGQVLLILTLADSIKNETSKYKSMFWGITLGFIILLIIFISEIASIGGEVLGIELYPIYLASSLISIGHFVQRTEIFIASAIFICQIIKIAVILFALSKCMAHIFKLSGYKNIVLPLSLLIVTLSAHFFKGAIELDTWKAQFFYLCLIFQILFPTAVWIAAEFKKKPTFAKGGQSP